MIWVWGYLSGVAAAAISKMVAARRRFVRSGLPKADFVREQLHADYVGQWLFLDVFVVSLLWPLLLVLVVFGAIHDALSWLVFREHNGAYDSEQDGER